MFRTHINIITLLLCIIFSSCHSQTKIYFNPDTTTHIQVTCIHDRLNTNGNPENLKWIIFQQLSPASFAFHSDTCFTEDIQTHLFSVITATTDSFYHTYFIAVAVDSAGNCSDTHSSLDNNAAYGGWILVPDRSTPSSPDTLNLSF